MPFVWIGGSAQTCGEVAPCILCLLGHQEHVRGSEWEDANSSIKRLRLIGLDVRLVAHVIDQGSKF